MDIMTIIMLAVIVLIAVILVFAGVKVVPQSETSSHQCHRFERAGLRLPFAASDYQR